MEARDEKVLDYGKRARRTRFLPPALDRWLGVLIVAGLIVLAVLYATGIFQGGL